MSGELDRPLPADAEEKAIDIEDDEGLEDLGLAGERELRAIDAALVRIEDGSYGLCRECGEAISPARLEALPATALCRSCAHWRCGRRPADPIASAVGRAGSRPFG